MFVCLHFGVCLCFGLLLLGVVVDWCVCFVNSVGMTYSFVFVMCFMNGYVVVYGVFGLLLCILFWFDLFAVLGGCLFWVATLVVWLGLWRC